MSRVEGSSEHAGKCSSALVWKGIVWSAQADTGGVCDPGTSVLGAGQTPAETLPPWSWLFCISQA